LFVRDICLGGEDIVGGRQLGRLSIRVVDRPVLQMGVAVRQEQIYQQAAGELLDVYQPTSGELVDNPAQLFVVGAVVLLVRILEQNLCEVFGVNTLLLFAAVKTADRKCIGFLRQVDRRQAVQITERHQADFRNVHTRQTRQMHG